MTKPKRTIAKKRIGNEKSPKTSARRRVLDQVRSKKPAKSIPKQTVNLNDLAVLQTGGRTKRRIIIFTYRIKALLKGNKRYRDSDQLLCNRFQNDELKRLRIDPNKVNVKEFYKLREHHLLTSEDTIGRLRRVVQQNYPSLRGKKYLKRKNKQLEVQDDMKGTKSGVNYYARTRSKR